MNFLKALKEKSNITYTENGAVTYKSTESECLDLFYQAGALRNASEKTIQNIVQRAFIENSNFTMKILFYARDIRGGLGERRFFRIAINYIAGIYPESIRKNLKYISEYGRWDDILSLYNISALKEEIINIINTQLNDDIGNMREGKDVSLLAKWLPSVNTSSEESRRTAKSIANALGMSEKTYRKKLSELRKYIDIIENRLRQRDYTFEYSKQPSNALMCYKKAFIRNDCKRYMQYLNDVRNGKADMNTGTLYPYEIVRHSLKYNISSEEQLSLDTTWNSLADIKNSQNAIAVIDGSGSMYCGMGSPKPYEAALSLGLYFAEHSKGAFANHFITFSMSPKLVEIKGNNIVDKVKYASAYNECANTNLQAVFDLILKTALSQKTPQHELPDTIYVISDMEFDSCVYDGRRNMTNFEAAEKKFKNYGYKLPNVVFWNVASRNSQVPVKMHQSGATLVSGSSPKIFDMVKNGEMNPYKFMMDIINSERYSKITA